MVVVVSLGESIVVISLSFYFQKKSNKGGDRGFEFRFLEGESKHIVLAGVTMVEGGWPEYGEKVGEMFLFFTKRDNKRN